MAMAESFSNEVICKLKQIKPYTESQLFGFHSNPELDNNSSFVDKFIQDALNVDGCEFYQNVHQLNKWREALAKTSKQLSQLRSVADEERNRSWLLRSETIIKKSRCKDGRPVEAKHTFTEAIFQDKSLKSLEMSLTSLQETIINDYCYHHFMVQISRKEIEYEINKISLKENIDGRINHIKQLLSSLFAFVRKTEMDDDSSSESIKQWISRLIAAIIPLASRGDRLFILNHVLRCPGGISEWAAGFVQCPSPLQARDNAEAIKILNHGMNMISTILSPIRGREKFIPGSSSVQSPSKPNDAIKDDYWHMIDPDIDEGEDVLINKINLCEFDVIHLLKQVPFDDMLQFLTMGRTYPDDSDIGIFGNHSETSMLKLLAISTKMIQILRQGLLTFNCMRFRTLTDYITLLIRKTVSAVSKFWQECKGSFNNQDYALILRLQVEYDHFILRSVVTILSSQRFGVWKFVSVIPFVGVTESMMWHIVWVFYNNGRDEIDELGGLCPYFSDAYWKSKFNEPAMKYLFREKLPSLSGSEVECLLRSLSNMIQSRASDEVEFINTIACEMFEMSFLVSKLNLKMIVTCIETLTQCSNQHPFIISALINKINESSTENEMIIDLFTKLVTSEWNPSSEILDILRQWLIKQPLKSLFNRLARIILIKFNYGFCDRNTLHLKPSHHRAVAGMIYEAVIAHTSPIESFESVMKCTFRGFDFESVIKCAKGDSIHSFLEWAWRTLLLLKLHVKDFPSSSSYQNDLHQMKKLAQESDPFYPIPNLLLDCDLFPICKGYETKNALALYLAIVMTEMGHNTSSFEDGIDILVHLLNNRCFIPCLNVLHGFVPVHRSNLHILATNSKFLTAFSNILHLDTSQEVDCLIGLIQSQIQNEKDKQDVIHFWIELLCESTNAIFSKSSSWFLSSTRGLQQLVHIIDGIVSHVFLHDESMTELVEVFAAHLGVMDNLKLAGSGWTRLLPLSSNSKKCEWTTPLHALRDKYPEKVWLGYLLLKSDSLRMEKIWESIVIEMGSNMDMTIETAVKAICERFNRSPIPLNLLPINGWAKLIIDAPLNHTLMPLLFYNFFSCFFANSTSGGSSGLRTLVEPLHKNLRKKLETLVENNLRQSSDKSDEIQSETLESSIHPKSVLETTKFYRAALLWLQDLHLHDAFIDIDHLPGQYQIEMLKSVMNSLESYFRSFVDENQIRKDNMIFSEMWDDLKKLKFPPSCEDTVEQCSELSVDLNLKSVAPPEEKIPNIMFYDLDLIPSIRTSSKSLLNYLYSNIRTLMEEKSYCDNRSRKIHGLNLHLLDLIPTLYDHVKKELKVRVTCDKDGVYPDCAGSAIITIEFSVAVENADKLKAIERNRIDFENVLSELLELPSDRVVCASIFINKCIPYLLEYSDQAADSPEYLLQSFLSWINDSSTVNFAPAKSLFNLLIDSLNFNEEGKRDENSLFLLQTSLEKPSVIEYLGPRLAPSKCSIQCFLKMYELIQRNLHRTPPNILFVLLSKVCESDALSYIRYNLRSLQQFDVNSWLKVATIEECHEFMNILINALFSIGIDADKDKSMLLGLYRKHLQYMFLCRFPEFLEPVISNLLLGMDKFVLYPLLWNDMLLSFGFFLRADHEKLEDIVREMRKYAESQPIFSSSELSSLITLFSDHFKKIKEEKSKIDLVEYFHIYIRPISIMLSTASSMWIFVNYKENNNFERTWDAYLSVWKPWLFSSSTSQTVDKKDFDLIWDLFMFNLHYFILTFSNFSTHLLSNSWRILADYYAMTKHSTLLNVEAMQEKLKNLPWSQYKPSKEDLKLMYDAAQHERCPPTILISHIIREVNWNAAAQGIPFENLPQTMEWLAGTVIFLADKPESFRLDSMPIYLMNSDQCRNTCRLLRHRIDLLILLQSRYDISQFYLKMIRVICGLTIGEEYFQSGSLKDEFRRKQIIYIDTICGIILDVVRSDSNPLKDKPDRVSEFFRNCLSDIRPSMAEGLEHRGMIFSTLLKFINSVTISDPDHFMLNCVFDFVNSDKTLILELLTSSFGAIKFLPLFILFSEKCIKAFAEADGKASMIIERYVIPKDFDASIYRICNQNHAYLTLYVIYHIEKSSQEILPILSSMVEWSRHLKLEASSELQILALWYVLARDISTTITADDSCNSLLQSSIKLCRVQINFVEEVISQGFLSFMKLRKSSSLKTAFLVATMAGFLLRRLSEIFPSFHPLYNDLSNLMKTVIVKIQNIRKDKGFVGNIPLADKCLELMESDKKIEMEGIRLLRGWLLAFHSRDAIFRFILSNFEAGAS